MPLPDGRTLLATGGTDQTVRLLNPVTNNPAGNQLIIRTDRVRAVTALQLPHDRALLATGIADGTVRLRDPATGNPAGSPWPATPTGCAP
jgi:WD40 repeat protein